MELKPALQNFKVAFSTLEGMQAGLSSFHRFIESYYPEWLEELESQQQTWVQLQGEKPAGNYLQHYSQQKKEQFRAALSDWIDQLIGYETRMFPVGHQQKDRTAVVTLGARPVIRRFFHQFDQFEKDQKRVQFYFLEHRKGNHTTMVLSRLLSILKDEHIDVYFSNGKAVEPTPLSFVPMASPEIHQGQFLSAFNRHWPLDVDTLKSLDLMIDYHFPFLKGYHYLPWVFSVSPTIDARGLQLFLEWVTEHFAFIPHYTERRYLFFFILNRIESQASKNISNQQAILSSALRHRGIGFSVLPRIKRVTKKEIEDWLSIFWPGIQVGDPVYQQIFKLLPGREPWKNDDVVNSLQVLQPKVHFFS